MRATKELVVAMRDATKIIEATPEGYNQEIAAACNLGMLARAAMRISRDEFYAILNASRDWMGGHWENEAVRQLYVNVCPTTGIPMNVVFRTLYNIGLTQVEDFAEIENAAFTPEEAIAYFHSKANELEAQLEHS